MNIDKILQTYKYTHMPYIYYNLDNMPNLLFTRMYNNYWKMCHFDGTDINDIDLNLKISGNYYHCQPTCYMTTNGVYHVSFCIQVNGKIYLFYSESKNILKLKPRLVNECACGCINENHICIGYLNKTIYILKNTKTLYKMLNDENFFTQYNKNKENLLYSIKFDLIGHNLSRIDYIPGETNKYLVSWASHDTSDHGSILIDLTEQTRI